MRPGDVFLGGLVQAGTVSEMSFDANELTVVSTTKDSVFCNSPRLHKKDRCFLHLFFYGTI